MLAKLRCERLVAREAGMEVEMVATEVVKATEEVVTAAAVLAKVALGWRRHTRKEEGHRRA